MSTTLPPPSRILAIKLADLGDVLCITPALRALRVTFPHARLDALLNPHTASLLDGSGLVDEVIRFPKTQFEGWHAALPQAWSPLGRHLLDLHARNYDIVVNFHHLTTPLGRAKQRALITATRAGVRVGLDNGHGRWFTHAVGDAGFGARSEVEYWLALATRVGATCPDTSLHWPASPANEAAADALLRDAGLHGRRFAVLHPGSGGYSLARRWEPDKFAALADRLSARADLAVVLVGTPADDASAVLASATSPIVDLSGRTTVGQLAALLRRAALFVGADSGVMHLAAAARTPLVAIFGPTNHRAWGPWTPYSPSRVVRLGISCSPCAYVEHRVGWRHGCADRTCLADLSVEQVWRVVQSVLAETNEMSHW